MVKGRSGWFKSVLMVFLLLSVGMMIKNIHVAEAATGSAGADTAKTRSVFSDVSADDPNYIYIDYLNQRNIMKGFPDGSYHPEEELTRAQAAVIVVRAAGLNIGTVEGNSYKDVPTNHWASAYIAVAVKAGYLHGFPDGTFRPDDQLTRAQGISIIMRLSSLKERAALPTLIDMKSNHWAAADMATALEMDMIEPSKDGTRVYPEAAMTRSVFARALSILLTKDPTLLGNTTTTNIISSSIISPTSVTFNKSASTQTDVNITLTLNGNTLNSITNGGTILVHGSDYAVNGTAVKIKKEYLSTLSVGTTRLTFNFNSGTSQVLTIAIIKNNQAPTASQWVRCNVVPSDVYLYGVAYGDGKFMVVGDSGTIMSSVDGTTWTTHDSGHNGIKPYIHSDIAWNGRQWVIVGGCAVGGGVNVFVSSDGINWEEKPCCTPIGLNDIVWNGSKWMAVGGTGAILSSNDGIKWGNITPCTENWKLLQGIDWDGSRWVVVGWNVRNKECGIITTSSIGGSTWKEQEARHILFDVAGNGSQWVAVGASGTILSSIDGTAWTAQNSGTMNDLYGIAWNGSYWLAVGEGGTVLSSPDGASWKAQNSGTMELRGIAWNGSQWMVVGSNGTILMSN